MTSAVGRLHPLFTWRAAIAESALPSTTRHVALALSLYMSERGDSMHPGAPRLSRDTGLHETTIRDHLGRLVERGWLTLVERGGLSGGRRRSNEYSATVPPVQDDPSSSARGDPSSSAGGQKVHPSSSARLPLAQDDPISSENSSIDTAVAPAPAPSKAEKQSNASPEDDDPTIARAPVPDTKTRAREIAKAYYDKIKETTGHPPPLGWMAIAKHVEAALAGGFDTAAVKFGLWRLHEERRTITRTTLWNAAQDAARASAGRPRYRTPTERTLGTNTDWITALDEHEAEVRAAERDAEQDVG